MIYSIDQIKQMRDKITPDRWRYYEQHNGFADWGQPDPPPVYIVEGPDYSIDSLHEGAIDHEPDAEFIASAPEIVDFMVTKIDDLEAENERLRAALEEIREHKGYEITPGSSERDCEYVEGANDALKQCKAIARQALGGDA